MNHFERVAIFTAIEAIENQIRGVKTLLAASSTNQPADTKGAHRVTRTSQDPIDSDELSEEDEAKLDEVLEAAREAHVGKLKHEAEAVFQEEWDKTAKTLATLDT